MKACFISIFLFLFCNNTFAQNSYFVSLLGSANNTGSINSPFRKISQAAAIAQPGDFIYVREGVYKNANFNDNDIWNSESVETITCNGAANNYITIMPYNNEQVVFEFDATYGILLSNCSYVTFQNFTVKGIQEKISYTEADNAWGLYRENGIDKTIVGNTNLLPLPAGIIKPSYYNGRGLVANSSHHINLINNTVYNCTSSGVRVQQSDYVNVIGNVIYNNTFWTTMGVGALTVAEALNYDNLDIYKIIIEKNKVYNNENKLISWNPTKSFITYVIDEGSGIFLTRNENTYLFGKIKISNNLSYNNGASGIMCHFTNKTLINNNTVYNNGANNDGTPGGIGINNTDAVIIANNLIYASSNKWAIGTTANPNTNTTVLSNIVFNNNSATTPVFNNINTGWVNANPLFINAAADNFNLQSTSPAINAANTTYAEPTDINNIARNTPDVGAFEYQILLPIKIQYFYLDYLPNNKIALNWQLLDFNNNTFIEKSTDGISWEKTTTNISNNGNNFYAVDHNPHIGKSYYRLVQINQHGQKEFSNILIATIGNSFNDVKVFPNPTVGFVVIKRNNIKCIRAFDITGKEINLSNKTTINPFSANVDLNTFTPGVYYLLIDKEFEKVIKH